MITEAVNIETNDLEKILRDAQTGKGSRKLLMAELEYLLPILKESRLFIPAMESFQRKTDDRWPWRLDLSIIWEKPKTPEDELRKQRRAESVVRGLLKKMHEEGKEMEILIWLDDLHPSLSQDCK